MKNTENTSWESDFDEGFGAVFSFPANAIGATAYAHATEPTIQYNGRYDSHTIKDFIRTLLSKERAEGERRERERILAALPEGRTYQEVISSEDVNMDINEDWGFERGLRKAREIITTLPADSTEVC